MKKVLFLVLATALAVSVACKKETPVPAPAPQPTAVVVAEPTAPAPPVPVATKPKPGCTEGATWGVGGAKPHCYKCINGLTTEIPCPQPVGTPVPVATKKPVCKDGDMTGGVGTANGPLCMKCVKGQWVEDLGCK